MPNGTVGLDGHTGGGETVIPFAYDEAWPFNKYGLAVVEDRKGSYLIDTDGKIVPGTENLSFFHYYEYDDRFFKFYYSSDSYDEGPVGMYDTKERKILIEPLVQTDLVRVIVRVVFLEPQALILNLRFDLSYIIPGILLCRLKEFNDDTAIDPLIVTRIVKNAVRSMYYT